MVYGIDRVLITLLFTSTNLGQASMSFEAHSQQPEEAIKLRQGNTQLPVSKQIKNSLGMDFIWIPAGSFTMGTDKEGNLEKPPHIVTIREPFYLGKYEVSQVQWVATMSNNRSHFKGDNLPVENVSGKDVREFLQSLNKRNDGYSYRLPTEAEWEYACRAGSTTKYSYGDDVSQLGEYAWYDGNSDYRTHPVGQKKPNNWGLCDMHGNVWEWCQDQFHEGYSGAPADGSAWEGSKKLRVLRGGASDACGNCSSSAARAGDVPDRRAATLGVRVVATLTK